MAQTFSKIASFHGTNHHHQCQELCYTSLYYLFCIFYSSVLVCLWDIFDLSSCSFVCNKYHSCVRNSDLSKYKTKFWHISTSNALSSHKPITTHTAFCQFDAWSVLMHAAQLKVLPVLLILSSKMSHWCSCVELVRTDKNA